MIRVAGEASEMRAAAAYAIESWHSDVENNQVRFKVRRELNCFFSIARLSNDLQFGLAFNDLSGCISPRYPRWTGGATERASASSLIDPYTEDGCAGPSVADQLSNK